MTIIDTRYYWKLDANDNRLRSLRTKKREGNLSTEETLCDGEIFVDITIRFESFKRKWPSLIHVIIER